MTVDPELLAIILNRCDIADTGYRTPCWLSNRARHTSGYTKLGRNGRTLLTHRVAYEAEHGAIPDGLVIDHLCRVRICANPAHLEAVTTRENLLRGEGFVAVQARVTHCPRGHEYTPENTYHRPDDIVSRDCLTCRRDRSTSRRIRPSEPLGGCP